MRTFRAVAVISHIALLIFIIMGYNGCESDVKKAERLAKVHCASCHLFPDPGMLDKKTWEKSVLPEMGFRMGFLVYGIMEKINPTELQEIVESLPKTPMISVDDWNFIQRYYITKAPDSIAYQPPAIKDTMNQFETLALPSTHTSLITLLKYDSASSSLFLGERLATLFVLDNNLSKRDSFRLLSPPSDLKILNDSLIISQMGIMDPNDQAEGTLMCISPNKRKSIVIQSLRRPVYFEISDLNNDKLEDYIVCSFGNYMGNLTLYENSNEGYKQHVLSQLPGARKVVVKDFDMDGMNDIMALFSQGDERIVIYYNKGNFNFEEKVVARFPAVYGSNYFELADFNSDGHPDIVCTNGDNADFSMIFKPYHGVRILLNDGKNNFKESWSFPMPGASQAVARDFDQDGDVDIAAISFFPDFKNTPERGFIYFECTGENTYLPRISKVAGTGRWLVMEAADYDKDNDIDIILGAYNASGLGGSDAVYDNPPSLLVFKNNLN